MIRNFKNFSISIFLFLFLVWPNYLQAASDKIELKLSFDDGLQCFINGTEVVNLLTETHRSTYWNRTIEVSKLVKAGINLIACQVVNKEGQLTRAQGYFDLSFSFKGQKIIPEGFNDGWRYYISDTEPPLGPRKQNWTKLEYNDAGWFWGAKPFDGAVPNVNFLKETPSKIWLRKPFVLSQSLWDLSLNNCWEPIIHRFEKLSKENLESAPVVVESSRPLITGFVPYGNKTEIYLDDKLIGEAVVQGGEETGVANFHFRPKDNLPVKNQSLKIVTKNKFTNKICSQKIINFSVKPQPSPIIHRLGNIPFVERAGDLFINTSQPLITGLVKYGFLVDIYLNQKLVGTATVKGGEKTGVANFYFRLPELKPGHYTFYAVAKKKGNFDIISPPSQIFTFTFQPK